MKQTKFVQSSNSANNLSNNEDLAQIEERNLFSVEFNSFTEKELRPYY